MIFKILLALTVVLQCIFAPTYIISTKPGCSIKTLILKAACSTIFLAAGIIAAIGSGGFDSVYPKLMVIGFACSWIGDVMLHWDPKTPRIIAGGLGFLTAHVLFITSYIKTEGSLTGKTTIISARDIFIIIGVFALAVIIYFALKLKAGKLLVPIAIYAVVLSFMIAKAVDLGIALFDTKPVAAILIPTGAFMFAASDFTLGISFLGKTDFKKQALNMALYLPAQMLLALSIYFI